MLAPKPANLGFAEAAAAPGAGQTALHCLKKGRTQPEHRVLIYGASGAVGKNAVHLAENHFGAEVTGVCRAVNVALARSLGADRVIDYTREDFTRSCTTYDVILDAVGRLSPSQAKRARKLAGVYLSVHADSGGGDKLGNLLLLEELIEGDRVKPVIDRV